MIIKILNAVQLGWKILRYTPGQETWILDNIRQLIEYEERIRPV